MKLTGAETARSVPHLRSSAQSPVHPEVAMCLPADASAPRAAAVRAMDLAEAGLRRIAALQS